MFKPRLYIFLAVLVLVLAFTVTGCSSSKEPARQDEKVIKIGFIGPISGDMKTFGESARNAFNLAVEQSGGKVGDYSIETIILDDRNDAAVAADVATRLIAEDKVQAIVGSLTHRTTFPISQIANGNKVVMVAGAATNPAVTLENGVRKDFVFRACYIDPLQGAIAARFASNNLKAKTAAVLYNKEDSYYNTGLAASFKDTFIKSGGNVLAFESYLQNDVDFSEKLNNIARLKPDILYLPDLHQKAGLIAKQAREKKINAIFIGGDGWDSTEYESAMEGGYFTNHFSASDPRPEVKKWVEDYRSRYGSAPDARSTLYYDATNLLLNAIKVSNSDDPAVIKDALQATRDFPAVSGKISFSADGNPIKPAAVMQVKEGKQVYVTTMTP
ncbi:ABC transporter substrate-binding protein [Pelotomaculum propionicicum]|uniref:ABC transporter substrate-binding protein n=1 Tax=Pelotomaculum propionicicum TaxID=258475 RepID=UPI003B79D1FB